MPPALTCSACHHHTSSRPAHGLCTANPPTMPIHTSHGIVMTYITTEDTLIACGKFAARPTESEAAPVLETKVEPKPDVARMPRPEPARDPQRRDQRRPGR